MVRRQILVGGDVMAGDKHDDSMICPSSMVMSSVRKLAMGLDVVWLDYCILLLHPAVASRDNAPIVRLMHHLRHSAGM